MSYMCSKYTINILNIQLINVIYEKDKAYIKTEYQTCRSNHGLYISNNRTERIYGI